MPKESEHPICQEWEEYYLFLEGLRRTGACNMWGASIYIKECFSLSEEKSKKVLLSWIENYDELNKKYGWQPE